MDQHEDVTNETQQVESKGVTGLVAQVCGSSSTSDAVFGVITSTSAQPFALLQSAMISWSEGTCVRNLAGNPQQGQVSVWKINYKPQQSPVTGRHFRILSPRSDCQTVTVAQGDSCESLASKVSYIFSDVLGLII